MWRTSSHLLIFCTLIIHYFSERLGCVGVESSKLLKQQTDVGVKFVLIEQIKHSAVTVMHLFARVCSVFSGGRCGWRVLCQRRGSQVKVQGRTHHLPLGALQRLFRGLRTQSGWSQIPSGGETSNDMWQMMTSGMSYMFNVMYRSVMKRFIQMQINTFCFVRLIRRIGSLN